ncbi:DUF4388 domain-containing protein [candidate division KSB1 bacterium]|nr:DUF4388 domain-containing protein [candidate division KSB1 bacterium]
MSTRLSGNLAKLNFSDIIEATCLKAKSCQLIVRNAVGEGTIFFSQGEPCHAQMGNMEGQDAVHRLIQSIKKEGGVFTVDFDIKIPSRTISSSWREIANFDDNNGDSGNSSNHQNLMNISRGFPAKEEEEEKVKEAEEEEETEDEVTESRSRSRGMNVNQLLKELQKKSSEIQGTAVVSTEGLVIASVLKTNFEEEHLAAISAIVLSLGERIVTELERGDLEQVYVKGKKGYVLITHCTSESLLVVIATSLVKLGMIFLDTKRTAENLGEYL